MHGDRFRYVIPTVVLVHTGGILRVFFPTRAIVYTWSTVKMFWVGQILLLQTLAM